MSREEREDGYEQTNRKISWGKKRTTTRKEGES